jgi:AcrR family transcriptional regulator
VFEREAGPGGVWWKKPIRGREVDVPSAAYSLLVRRYRRRVRNQTVTAGERYSHDMPRPLKNPERSYRARGQSARRQELLSVACRLFAEKGYATATMADIAEAAGIQHGSLYHHFPTRDDILVETLDGFWSDLLGVYREAAEHETDSAAAIAALIRAAMTFLVERNDEVKILYNDWVRLERREKYQFIHRRNAESEKIWLSVLNRGIRDGTFRDDLDVDVLYRTLQGAVLSVVRWYRPGGALDRDELTQSYARMFLNGLRPAVAD